jgi:stearoyl-CoA desaturase (delta-9 desaturase)
VTLPTLADEWNQFGDARRRMWRRAKAALVREHLLLDDEDRAHLYLMLSRSEVLNTVHQYRERLKALWESSSASNEALVNGFREWIHEAERSGIDSLERFAQRLRGYRIATT